MEENKRTKANRLKKKIDKMIRITGYDENFRSAVKFHLEVMYSKVDESNIKSQYDYCNLLMSKLFIDTMDLYPTKRFKCQVIECSDWPLSLLPSEVFGEVKLSDEYRKNSFYKCLKKDDVLDCRVASVLPTEYQLRVIHKYGATRILDDLNITVAMLRNDSEVLSLELCEIIRVVVSNIENEINIFVSVKDENGELGEDIQLGRISEDHLPTYVLDPPEHFFTYSDYLKNLLGFRNPILLKNIFEGFGINPRGVYTFYPICESLKPVDGNLLLKEMNLSTVRSLTDLALQDIQSGHARKALLSVQKAIHLYPMSNQTEYEKTELSKLYEIRGKIHAEIEKPGVSKYALGYWKLAHETDPANQCGDKDLSRVSFMASSKFYKTKDYKIAARYVEVACKLDESNDEASALLQYLKSKHPEAFVNLEEESLLSLEEKRKLLVTQLKKMHNLKAEGKGNS